MNCLEKEKIEIGSEIQKVNEKLQEESYLRLVLENEVSDINEQLNKEKSEQADSLKQIQRFKVEVEKFEAQCKELNDDLVKNKEELELATTSLYAKKNELAGMEELLGKSAKLKEEMDNKIANYEEQLVNLQCTMEQQVSSLKFQLSSEALKHDEKIKVGNCMHACIAFAIYKFWKHGKDDSTCAFTGLNYFKTAYFSTFFSYC